MPEFILIKSSKETVFDAEAKTVLESHKFANIHANTYMGVSGASNVATTLKTLKSYKEAKAEIYHGTLAKT